jgi:hypothetical protein
VANVALTVLLTEEPATTETLPELPSAKSKLLSLENHALATGLGFALFLKAWAFSSASVETLMGAEYFVDDCVGDDPSTV